jgi:hypothetical protein
MAGPKSRKVVQCRSARKSCAVALAARVLTAVGSPPVSAPFSQDNGDHACQPDLAVEHLERAMRLSPIDPQRPGIHAAIAAAHFVAGRFDVAASVARSAILDQLRRSTGYKLANDGHDTRASSTIWAIKISCTRFATPKWRLIGSRISGRIEPGPWRRLAAVLSRQ